jgi:hypothetical protein
MERNLYNAVHCKPTLTELATLALYVQTITHPYMCQIWEPNSKTTNMLDLGPLHLKVEQHIDKIISNPKGFYFLELTAFVSIIIQKNLVKAVVPNTKVIFYINFEMASGFEPGLGCYVNSDVVIMVNISTKLLKL